jgi:hypothetical protein
MSRPRKARAGEPRFEREARFGQADGNSTVVAVPAANATVKSRRFSIVSIQTSHRVMRVEEHRADKTVIVLLLSARAPGEPAE